jgi:hypothetical protein
MGKRWTPQTSPSGATSLWLIAIALAAVLMATAVLVLAH